MFLKTDLKCIIWLQLEGTQPVNSAETLALMVWMIWMVFVSLVLKSTQKIMAKMVLFAAPISKYTSVNNDDVLTELRCCYFYKGEASLVRQDCMRKQRL